MQARHLCGYGCGYSFPKMWVTKIPTLWREDRYGIDGQGNRHCKTDRQAVQTGRRQRPLPSHYALGCEVVAMALSLRGQGKDDVVTRGLSNKCIDPTHWALGTASPLGEAISAYMDWLRTRLRRWTNVAGSFKGTPSRRRAWSKSSHAASSIASSDFVRSFLMMS